MTSATIYNRLLNLQFQPIRLLPWGLGKSIPAGVVLRYPDNRVILIGHDIQGSTSAHFVGGTPWEDEINNNPGMEWAWIFNE